MKRLSRIVIFFILSVALITSCKKPEKKGGLIASIEDLAGREVAVCVGTTQDKFIEEHYPEIIPFRVESAADIFAPLFAGKVDAVVLDGALANFTVQDNPDLCIVGRPVMNEDLGMAFNDEILKNKFNLFLSELRHTGELSQIIHKWERGDTTVQMPKLNYSGKNGELKIYADLMMPMLYVKHDEFCGFDAEIIARFCASEGYVPNFSLVNFSAGLLAISSGTIDILCGGISITKERAKQMMFSDVYYSSPSVLLTTVDKVSSVIRQAPNDISEKRTLWDITKESFYNNLIKENRYKIILEGLKTTLIISVLSIIFGTLLGGILCFLRMSKRRLISSFSKSFVALVKGIPMVVFLMLMFYVVFAASSFSSLTIAIITFSIILGCGASEIFRSAITSIDKGQTEAGCALGFTKTQNFIYIIAPQAIRRAIKLYQGEIVSLVQSTSIVGYIAVQDLTKASDIIRSRTFDAFFPLIFISVIYFLLAYLLTFLITLINKKNERNN